MPFLKCAESLHKHTLKKESEMKKVNFQQAIRYFCIGVSGVLIDASIYSLLLAFSVQLETAKGIGITTAVIYGYYLNASWTFQGIINSTSLMRYCVLYGSSIAINIAINSCIIGTLGRNLLFIVIAFLVATTISMIINFIGLKFWVFKK